MRTFLGWRIAAAATVLAAAMVLDQPGANAGIDASGAWLISEFGMGFIEDWQQTGSSLTTRDSLEPSTRPPGPSR